MTWTVRIVGWKKFQHYGKSSPPWVKLHRSLLDKRAWRLLPSGPSKLLVDLWLLAAEADQGSKSDGSGEIRMSLMDIGWRLRLDAGPMLADMQLLVTNAFIDISSDALEVAYKESTPEQSRDRAESEKRQESNTAARAATQEDNAYRVLLPLIREHLWKPDGKPPEIKGEQWTEARECTVIRELRKHYSVSDLEVVILGMANMLRGYAELERPEWLPAGGKGSLRAVYHTRSGVVQMVEKCQRAYWSVQNKRPKGKQASGINLLPDVA